MRKCVLSATLLIALLSTTTVFVSSAAASPRVAMSEAMQNEALAAHNAVRQRVAQSESERLGGVVSIPDLSWDADIASVAQDWADQQAALLQQGQLYPQHRPDNVYGENMYWAWSTPNQPDLSPTIPVTWWADEQQFYDYDTNICTYGQVCGHYTQLVWDTTSYVGCGQATWSQGDNQYVLWVCDYAAPGNLTINGEKLRPYSVS